MVTVVAVPDQLIPPKSTLAPMRGMSTVTVRPVLKLLLTTTLSWQSGTRLVHPWVLQGKLMLPVAVCVAAVVNVIPTLPKQSPLSPVIADRSQFAAPAP